MLGVKVAPDHANVTGEPLFILFSCLLDVHVIKKYCAIKI